MTDLPVSSPGARRDGTRAADAVEALSDAVGAIAGVLDLESVLQLIVDRARTLVPARYAALGIVNDRGRIEQFITSGISDAQRARLGDPPEGHGLLGLIITEGRSFRIAEISAHPASYGFPPHHPPMHSLLGVPVRLKGRAIGNFYLTDKLDAPQFGDDDQRLVELFAQHAAIAIENARLHAAVGRLAVVEERERIGRDLHDGIIQSLYALGLSLEDVPDLMRADPAEAAARIDRAIDGLNATIGDLRGFIVGLRPDPHAEVGLAGLIAGIVEQFRRNTTAEVEVAIADDVPDLPDPRRSEVAHVAREALSNVSRHAAAGRVEVRLERSDEAVVLTVADNGRGFDPGAASPRGHYGLANMRERAAALGGRLDVRSRPGDGTTVMMTVPATRPGAPLEHTA